MAGETKDRAKAMDVARQLWRYGLGAKLIARLIGRNPHTVQAWLWKMELKPAYADPADVVYRLLPDDLREDCDSLRGSSCHEAQLPKGKRLLQNSRREGAPSIPTLGDLAAQLAR